MSALAGPLGLLFLFWLGLVVIAMGLNRAAARGDVALARMADVPDGQRDAVLGVAPPSYPGGLPARLATQLAAILDVEQVWVYSRPSDGGPVAVAATHGVSPDPTGRTLRTAGGPVELALASGEPFVGEHRGARPIASPLSSQPLNTVAALPLVTASGVSGVLAVATISDLRTLTLEDLDVLCDLGEGVAASLSEAPPASCVEDPILPSRRCDIETELHELEVTELARAMGAELGLTGVAARELVVAARFHDIGKLRVPEHILDKPGPLDEAEWAIMRRHAAWGAEMLLERPGFEAVATLVRFHHERWDGRGYPRGLAGERIPLGSRILAVCDAYGAMTRDRPYRRALTLEEVASELQAGAGSQFDPRVVETFGVQRELVGV